MRGNGQCARHRAPSPSRCAQADAPELTSDDQRDIAGSHPGAVRNLLRHSLWCTMGAPIAVVHTQRSSLLEGIELLEKALAGEQAESVEQEKPPEQA